MGDLPPFYYYRCFIMQDLVIGAITNYNYDNIKHWANSLDRSGFSGIKAVVCYDVDIKLMETLENRGYLVFKSSGDGNSIMVDRFYRYWLILNTLSTEYDIRYVVTTDIGDVVFQQNPSTWLEKTLNNTYYKINASSESIRYENEHWGRNNLSKAFGEDIYETYKENTIYNAGVMSGDMLFMRDLFLQIYLMCKGVPTHIEGGGGPDQAAYNIILNSASYSRIVRFTPSEKSWAAQLGTTGPQVKSVFGDHLLEASPQMIDEQICTSSGEPFCIVHQYNRVPVWREIIWNKYND